MEIFQNLNLDSGLTLVLCCVGLCGVGIILFFGLQILGGFFDVFFGFLGLFLDILAGGPIQWCSCLFLILGCGVCTFLGVNLATALQNCGTVEATNLCRLFGY